MKSIDVSTLKPGQVTIQDYYDLSGELLISKDVTLTERHLNILKRRNIFELYIRESGEDSELNKILTTEFTKLDDLELDKMNAPENPKAFEVMPELREIRSGEEGLKQLLLSDKIAELDRELRFGHTLDRPVGPPLKDRLEQITANMRTLKYKEEVQVQYRHALKLVRSMLNGLADARKIDGGEIRALIEKFLGIFITDRNILMNLAWCKHESEEYIYNHTLNVCLLSMNIAASAGYSEEQVIQISTGALLHDVGMLLVPRAIRLKQARLSSDEWFEIQKHPVLGLHILEKVSHLPEAVPYVAYQIHERENGKGYPKQRTGRFIHAFAKIVQCADIFEAVSSPRSYRKAQAPYQGMEILIKMTRQGLLPGEYVKAFLCYTSLFPVGSLIELNDHRIGKVVAANGMSFTKPIVSIISDKAGNPLVPADIYQIDLTREIGTQVIRCLPFDTLREIGVMKGF